MHRLDTVSDSTPEVIKLVQTISASPSAPECDKTKSLSSSKGSVIADCAYSHGHALLSSLSRVAALARRRALLVQETKSAYPAAAAQSGIVFVRLVLSMLSSSVTEAMLSPTTSTDEREGVAEARAKSTADAPRSPTAAALAPTDVDTAWLPWCSAGALDPKTADATFTGLCVHHCAEENSGLSGGTGGSEGGGGFPCQVVLQSYPVAIFSPERVHSLAHYWHSGASASRAGGGEDGAVIHGGDAPITSAHTSAAPCLADAMAAFRSRVTHHELRGLRAVARICEELLSHLDSVIAGEAPTQPTEDGTETRFPSACDSGKQMVVVLPIPIYGVALSVEDNQATRLERVGHLTTPLLKEVTGEASYMGPLTAALQQLHAWASTPEAASASVTTPPTLLLTRSRLRRLHAFASCFVERQCLRSSATTRNLTDLDVMKRYPVELLLPACLVHCQLGVSRSPSVVLLFYMDVFAVQWRRAACTEEKEEETASAPDGTPATTALGEESHCKTLVANPLSAVEVFHSLLSALVRVRPRVKPNVCFAVQLLSLWKRCVLKEDRP